MQSQPIVKSLLWTEQPALVNMLKPTRKEKEKTLSEYASNKFIPHVTAQLQHVKRIDIVWDEYVDNSLKATTRNKRGSGVRQLVAANNKLPSNWKEFLREDRNKQELFRFLAQCATSVNSGQTGHLYVCKRRTYEPSTR